MGTIGIAFEGEVPEQSFQKQIPSILDLDGVGEGETSPIRGNRMGSKYNSAEGEYPGVVTRVPSLANSGIPTTALEACARR